MLCIFPGLIRNYEGYQALTYSILFCKFSHCRNPWLISISNLLGLFFSQFYNSTFFLVPIIHILFLRTNPKMLWIHASSIIAMVKHIHAFWNRTKMKYPRYSMGPIFF